MARTRQTAHKSTRGPPHPIHHLQEVPNQEEPEQLEPEFVIVEDDDDNYYGYHEGCWVDTDTEEEPMELPEDHPNAPQGAAMRMLQEVTVPIQVPQVETMMKMVMMTQTHPMVMMRTQMMIQS
jgi:hypothetical protein